MGDIPDHAERKTAMTAFMTGNEKEIERFSTLCDEERDRAAELFALFKSSHTVIKGAQDDPVEYAGKVRKIAVKIVPLQAKLKQAQKAKNQKQIAELEPQIEKLHKQAEIPREHANEAFLKHKQETETIEKADAVAALK